MISNGLCPSTADRIRGSLVGGAAGDALGYAIEFQSEASIFSRYGAEGITSYEYDPHRGCALFSDDTQMTLFSAAGILAADTARAAGREDTSLLKYVCRAYLDWLKTQDYAGFRFRSRKDLQIPNGVSWILDIPELFSLRAPGNTCLASLRTRAKAAETDDFIGTPVNNSKGCGGVMRTAPAALRYLPGVNTGLTLPEVDLLSAQMAAVTHGHPLGYLPSAVINHVLSRILTETGRIDLKAYVLDAKETVSALFAGNPGLPVLSGLIDRAVLLSENDLPDLDNIHRLGEGWVGEETMAIALYCVLRYPCDFSKCLQTAVNHRGDSDSTGAVAGNLAGAVTGYDAIEEKWKTGLELLPVLLEIADDLASPVPADLEAAPEWKAKYTEMRRP